MVEAIIDGINYRLDKDNQTAEVIKRREGIYNDYDGDIIIPETVVLNDVTYRVTSIGEGAFYQCESLKSIIIPDSVTSIGDGAFWDCSSLTSITFQGTIAQWKEIALDENWKDKVPATVVHCTDGDVEI